MNPDDIDKSPSSGTSSESGSSSSGEDAPVQTSLQPDSDRFLFKVTTLMVGTLFGSDVESEDEDRKRRKKKETKAEIKNRNRRKRRAAEVAVLEYNLLYIPRILKNDLRRQYAVMFRNVYNSIDYSYMKGFLDTFYRPDQQLVVEKLTNGVMQRRIFYGEENCGNEWFERMHDAPDLRFELQDTQLKVRSDGTAVAIGQYEVRGTKIVQIDTSKIPPSELRKLASLMPANPSQPPDESSFPSRASSSSSLTSTSSDSLPSPSSDRNGVGRSGQQLNQMAGYTSSSSSSAIPENSFSPESTSPPLDNHTVFGGSPSTSEDALVRAFDEQMHLYREKKPTPPPKPAVPQQIMTIAFPFRFKGELFLQIDNESRITVTHLRVIIVEK